MVEHPEQPFNDEQIIEYMTYLEHAFDWIERERTQPERAIQSDPFVDPRKIPTDQYGKKQYFKIL